MRHGVQGGRASIEEDGYLYPATNLDGVMIAEAYLHDDSRLPHQIPGDLNALFPKARAAEPYPEVEEVPDQMEAMGLREVQGC